MESSGRSQGWEAVHLPFEELLRVWHPDKNPESCEVARDLRMLAVSAGFCLK